MEHPKVRQERNWRQSYQEMVHWHLGVLEEQPNMRVELNWKTLRVGDMSRTQRHEYARLQAEKDVNRAIHDFNRNVAVEKNRTGEAL